MKNWDHDQETGLPVTPNKRCGVLGVLILFLSTTALLGWLFNIPFLTTLLPGAPRTTPLTAILMFSFAGWLTTASGVMQGQHGLINRISGGLRWFVTLASLWVLADYLMGWLPDLEALIPISELPSSANPFPGRPSPHTSLAFLLLGSASLLLFHSANHRSRALILTRGAGAISWIALYGYLSSLAPFYSLSGHPEIGISPLTAIGILGAHLGIECLAAENGLIALVLSRSPGGTISRILLPLSFFSPLVLTWLVFDLSVINPELALSELAQAMALVSVFFTAVILTCASRLKSKYELMQKHSAERERLLEELRQKAKQIDELQSGLLKVCAWSKKVLDHGEWVDFDVFLKERIGIHVTHGMSDEAVAQWEEQLKEEEPNLKAMDEGSARRKEGDRGESP